MPSGTPCIQKDIGSISTRDMLNMLKNYVFVKLNGILIHTPVILLKLLVIMKKAQHVLWMSGPNISYHYQISSQLRAQVRVVSLCRHRRKKFPRKNSPSLKCTGLPNKGKFCKSNASFAHDSQNSTLSNGINNSTISLP